MKIKIDNLENMRFTKPASMEEVLEAEKELGVNFADAPEEALKLLEEEFNKEDIKYIQEFSLKKGVEEINSYYD